MTTRENEQPDTRDPGWSYQHRDFPPCSCGKPGCSDYGVSMGPMHSEQDPNTTHIKPLSDPYKATVGALVLDVLNGRVGTLTARGAGKVVWVRGANGYEWETDSRYLEKPPAKSGLSAELAARNKRSALSEHRFKDAS
ncbi:hypothetical protein ACFXDE_15905 [Kitasatospora sp. NPDC059408]|uniref:hypothetical protein n=1 Tax=Kitasatospora sp. NPDC059408 TaxID=3346823 RepID=UPI0036AB0330